MRVLQLSGSGECKVIMGFAFKNTYQDHEYIMRTMNTKHVIEQRLAFLLQAAHKIAVSCPKYYCFIIVSCSGNGNKANKLNCPWTLNCIGKQLLCRSICT